MAKSKSLKEVAKIMAEIDQCMLTTVMANGVPTNRPMSNNGDVTYDGNSYFFTYEKTKMAKDLVKNKNVALSFVGEARGDSIWISVTGTAKLVRDREVLAQHWQSELDEWFEDGVDTKGIVMIHVKGKRLEYWQGMDSGEIKLGK